MMRWVVWGLAFVMLLSLGGCGSAPKTSGGPVRDGAPPGYVDFSKIPDAVPRVEPLSRYGNPPTYEVYGQTYQVMPDSRGYVERGTASWYGTKFHGQRTSSGEPYDLYTMTAAHKTLPLPTYCQVTNLDNGRRIIVKVNDRGPFVDDRLIDLSYVAAGKLGINGTGRVEVRAIDPRRRAPDPVAPPPTLAATPPGGRSAPPVTLAARPTPAAQAQAVAKGQGIYVQAGAFSDRARADSLGSRLGQSLGKPVRIQSIPGAPAPLHKVQVGPFPTQEQAKAVRLMLAGMGLHEARVVAD